MSGCARALRPAMNVAAAIAVCAALFLVTAVLPIRGDAVAIVLLGAAYTYVIVLAMRLAGPLLAVPLAIAAALAFDSFLIPPSREFGGHWQNWPVMAMYIAIGILVGALGARTQRAHGRLAHEQAALRRVATLVARGVPAMELFDAVTAEVGKLLGADLASMVRYTRGVQTPVATWSVTGDHPDIRGLWPVERGEIATFIRDRLGISSTVVSPIVVEGELWGSVGVHAIRGRVFPPDAETALADFTELVATSIADANARDEAARLAEEQSALRRVATLVARESPQAEVFAAIAQDLGRLMGVDDVHMWRYDEDGAVTAVAGSGMFDGAMPVGARKRLPESSVIEAVRRTGTSARIDDYEPADDERALDVGARCAVATPIAVEGRIWGAMVAASRQPGGLAADSEARMAQFTELMATAIANVHARAERDASRARIVDATDQERRRVVRDLHDGAQQRLVHTVVTLKLAAQALDAGDGSARSLVDEALGHANQANAELRELARGILPASLTRGGLRPAVDALVSRIDLPVSVAIPSDRYPAGIEASAYFVLAEALTNIIKHAHADGAAVEASASGGVLHLHVRDDGVGGASADGNGLVGVEDRLTALGGELRIESPPGAGTVVEALLPLPE